MMPYILAGDSWAWKAFTEENYTLQQLTLTDKCLGDYLGKPFHHCITPGHGNLDILDIIVSSKLDPAQPILWVYTEPGRDYGQLVQKSEFGWLQDEDYFTNTLPELHRLTVEHIANTISNPIAFVGGLSDFPTVDIPPHWHVLCHSWQGWIAKHLNSQWFKHGWGASDVGWRMFSNSIIPCKSIVFAWDEQIKEWCWWQDQGYFCHEHPTHLANQLFAKHIQHDFNQWFKKYE